MNYLFVNWLGDKPLEKVFTSLRVVLWTNVLNKLLYASNKTFLFTFDQHEENQSFIDCLKRLELIQDGEQLFLQSPSNEQQEMMKNRLQTSPLISFDDDQRMLVNIEHVEKDYLLKSSKESSSRWREYSLTIRYHVYVRCLVRVPEDARLFDKFYSFEKAIEGLSSSDQLTIIHCCDFQSQYQCELFVVLSRILLTNYSHLRQVCSITSVLIVWSSV